MLSSGCTTVDPEARWNALAATAPTDAPLRWERSSADAEAIRALAQSALDAGLTRDEAVAVAVANNRALQAAFEDIGIAEADLVQAGLPTNPELAFLLAFPMSSGNTTVALFAALSDLWIIPARKTVAELQAQVVVMRVAAEIASTAADAADAYDAALAADTAVAPQGDLVRVLSLALDNLRGDRSHGRASDAEVDEVLGALAQHEDDLAAAWATRAAARAWLGSILALSTDEETIPLVDTIEALPASEWTPEAAVTFALERRFDLRREAIEIELAAAALELEKHAIVQDVDVAGAAQGGSVVNDSAGPAINIELPLFDQNQAQIARAEYRVRQNEKRLAATRTRARAEVLDALADESRWSARLSALARMRSAAEERAESARPRAGTLQSPKVESFAAKERLLQLQLDHIEAWRGMRTARIRLQRALWGAGNGNERR